MISKNKKRQVKNKNDIKFLELNENFDQVLISIYKYMLNGQL